MSLWQRATAPMRPMKASRDYGDLGTTAPPIGMLYDAYGVPLPNADQVTRDVHGREVQPETDPHQNYSPATADPVAVARRAANMRLRVERKQRLEQREVDEVRFRVLLWLARDVLRHKRKRADVPLRHMWWGTPNLDEYELRMGNAPADIERPRHLKRLDLAIDVMDMPARVAHCMRPGGIADQLVQQALDESDDIHVSSGALLAETVARLAHQMAWRGGA